MVLTVLVLIELDEVLSFEMVDHSELTIVGANDGRVRLDLRCVDHADGLCTSRAQRPDSSPEGATHRVCGGSGRNDDARGHFD